MRSSIWSRVGMVLIAAGMLPFLQFLNVPKKPPAQLGSKLALEDSPSDLRTRTNDDVIEAALKKPKVHWAWHELEGRELTADEVQHLIDGLINWMRTEFPSGNIPSIEEAATLLRKLDQAGLVSQPLAVRFNQTLHGGLRFKEGKNPLRLRTGRRTTDLEIDWSYMWYPNRELFGLTLLSELSSATLDAEPILLQTSQQNPSRSFCQFQPKEATLFSSLSPGKHKLHLEVETALVRSSDLTGIDLQQGLPSTDWPQPVERWTRTTDLEIQVYAKDQSIIETTVEPEMDPTSSGFSANPVFIQDERGKNLVSVSFEAPKHLPVHVSFDVTLRVKDRAIKLGPYFLIELPAKEGLARSTGQPPVVVIDRLDPEITTGDLVLTPNPIWVELDSRVDRIWGKEVAFTNILLVRPSKQDAPAAEKD